jgi:diguanylate cyclase (GGDEF)-like protein
MAVSIVQASARTARRVVLCAILGTAAVVVAFIAERVVFQSQFERLAALHQRATDLIGTIMLLDERGTMTAHVAAASGDKRWIEHYNANFPKSFSAIEEVLKLAPPDIAQTLERDTAASNQALFDLEIQIFKFVEEGRLEEARAVLAGADYARHKAVLEAGSTRFSTDLLAYFERELAELKDVQRRLFAAIALLSFLGFLVLWRVLSRSLDRSVTAYSQAETDIRTLALYDALTGLANRRQFTQTAEAAISTARATGGKVALLAFDLDRFKPVNDLHGHAAGDAVLREVARRLRDQCSAAENPARLGGDEFAVVLALPEGDAGQAVAFANRLIDAMKAPIVLREGHVRIGASVGLAVFPEDATDADNLLGHADLALYRAKAEGRGVVRVFEAGMDAAQRERHQLEAELREAAKTSDIVPFYQPLVDLRSGEVTGFEVLARWRHPVRGLVSPGLFIPIAEEAGLIDDITFAVLEQALSDGATWPPHVRLAVNVSPTQLKDAWFAERVLAALTRHGFPAGRLEIEITENALVDDDATTASTLASLKACGIRIALDDFGIGFSNFAHLCKLEIDKIKIDRSFVSGLDTRPEARTIVASVIGLSQSLGLTVTAEGVEREEDAAFLHALGCQQAQGFLYGRPTDAAAAAPLISPLMPVPGLAKATNAEADSKAA